ncbi:MAG: AAA family ATPase [Gammaproteobacteria bacterium]|nr:AAA family ATPase [Gammaproteobacteria bacterium]
MYELNDLLLLLRANQPLISIETHEEQRAVDLLKRCGVKLQRRVLRWSITKGLVRADNGEPLLSLASVHDLSENHQPDPKKILREIHQTREPGIYLLLDFHHYLDDPYVVRLLKEIAQDQPLHNHHLVFISHELKLPEELQRFTAQFNLRLPDREKLHKMVVAEAKVWQLKNDNGKLKADRDAMDLLVNNLTGLTESEARRLIRNAIYDDNAISSCDVERVQKAKYELLGKDGLLHFELETAGFDQVGGLSNLKEWLALRKQAFLKSDASRGIDQPKGILITGIQGGGKSLAARAVAGAWGVPLLRLDFGTLYNKFFGETEKNVREAIGLAEVMAPCVLWIDEIEKAISTGDYDSGTSQRLLATLLTWMAENTSPVFIVATANNIHGLPPELIRKGRLDEIFFVDLPEHPVRADIFTIHLSKRELHPSGFDISLLAGESEGFSGAEIEQVVVSSLYRAHATGQPVTTDTLLTEIANTRPLSIVMQESIETLRSWARDRTVKA